jgi:3-deoxy-D-manno-octulosonate 8-phosphate phosphatase (KDO 8-P phosphatase)
LTDQQVGYMGDDLQDLPVLRRVGFSAAPADAAPEVRSAVQWVSASRGGHGAVRECIEHVLRAQGRWRTAVADFLGS